MKWCVVVRRGVMCYSVEKPPTDPCFPNEQQKNFCSGCQHLWHSSGCGGWMDELVEGWKNETILKWEIKRLLLVKVVGVRQDGLVVKGGGGRGGLKEG